MNEKGSTPTDRGRILRGVLGTALIALAGLAIYMSWGALYDLAIYVGGMTPERAIVFPAVVDLVTVVAMLLALLVPNPSGAAKVLPWVTFGVFGVITVAGNAAHVVAVESNELALGEVPGIIVNAIPALALLMTTHLASVSLYGHDARVAIAEAEAEEAAAQPVKRRRQNKARPAPSTRKGSREDKRAEVYRLHEADHTLSLAQIAAETDVPKATVGRWLSNGKPTEGAAPQKVTV